MDPVTALGLVSSLITCVEFSAKVISATRIIFRSNDGLSIDNMNIEEVYTKLYTLSERLNKGPLALSGAPFEMSSDLQQLQELSHACGRDCQVILRVMDELKVRQGSDRKWKSVRAAFKSALSSKGIGAIESRLERTQRTMSLLFGYFLR